MKGVGKGVCTPPTPCNDTVYYWAVYNHSCIDAFLVEYVGLKYLIFETKRAMGIFVIQRFDVK